MVNPAEKPTIHTAHAADASWRLTHLGRRLGHALRRFDERVLQLMAVDVQVPLALSNLAARDQVGAAHIHITRHLSVSGSRLTGLAASAGMSKQAMADLVNQCEAWGLVTREPDAYDRRARLSYGSASRVTSPQASHWLTRSPMACFVMPALIARSVRREPLTDKCRVM